MSEDNKTATAPAKPEPSMATAPTGAPAGTPAQELTVQDLGVLKTIIEVAQSRGAFKANELEAVGKTYSKLEQFLASIQNQQVAKDPNANAPAPATAPATAPAGDNADPVTGEVK
jgi:uncharacterized protein YigE (DUF2233 family)|tara:strand:+ start:309 stop:653 length:345 start_codon:yes stop_codon:yes gene_type:complete